MSLSNPHGVKLATQTTMPLTIMDEDQGFRLESSTNRVCEDAGCACVKVLRSADMVGLPASVDYAATKGTALRDIPKAR